MYSWPSLILITTYLYFHPIVLLFCIEGLTVTVLELWPQLNYFLLLLCVITDFTDYGCCECDCD